MWKRIFARLQKRRRNAWRVDCHSPEWTRLTRLDGTTFRLVRYFMSADTWSRRRNCFGSRRRKIPAGPSRFTALAAVTWSQRKPKKRGRILNKPVKQPPSIPAKCPKPGTNQGLLLVLHVI